MTAPPHNQNGQPAMLTAATARCPIRISLHHFCPIDPTKWPSRERCLPKTDNVVRSLASPHPFRPRI
jgi:hypothetical protein